MKGHVLATGKLPGGGRFVILVSHHGGYGKPEYMLSTYSELPAKYAALQKTTRKRVAGGGAGGPSIGNPAIQRKIPVVLQDRQVCGGREPAYALAFGLLHLPEDTVTAQNGHEMVSFKKITIPASLHPDGVLVYALLPPGPNEVIVRTPTRRVVSREREWGRQLHCG